MAKRETLQAEDACMLMHTAMRKICDSKITSCMYNLVHLICAANLNEDLDVWLIFGGEVAANINAGMAPTTATRRAHKKLEDLFYARTEKYRKKGTGDEPAATRQWLYAFTSALDCFNDVDWAAMGSFLKEE